MAIETTFREGFREPDRNKAFETTMGGAGIEAVAGVAAVVMALRGLFGAAPGIMAAIGVMVIGIGLIIQGMAVAARYEDLLKALDAGGTSRTSAEVAGGMTTEFIAGLVGIVLGVLALLGIAPLALMATALITFGIGLLMSTAEMNRLISMGSLDDERSRRIFRVAVPATTGWQVLVGLTATILGILALMMAPELSMMLILVGVLAVGVTLLFSGSAVAGRLMLLLKH